MYHRPNQSTNLFPYRLKSETPIQIRKEKKNENSNIFHEFYIRNYPNINLPLFVPRNAAPSIADGVDAFCGSRFFS